MPLLWKAFSGTDKPSQMAENLLLERMQAIRLSQDTFVTNRGHPRVTAVCKKAVSMNENSNVSSTSKIWTLWNISAIIHVVSKRLALVRQGLRPDRQTAQTTSSAFVREPEVGTAATSTVIKKPEAVKALNGFFENCVGRRRFYLSAPRPCAYKKAPPPSWKSWRQGRDVGDTIEVCHAK